MASAGTAFAGVLYAYGWLILAQFYGSFRVSPEEVGLTFTFVTVRVAFIVVAIFLVGIFFSLILRPLARLKVGGGRAAMRPVSHTPPLQGDDPAAKKTTPEERGTLGSWWKGSWLKDQAGWKDQAVWAVGSWWVGAVLLGAVTLLLGAFGIDLEDKRYETWAGILGLAWIASPLWTGPPRS